MPDNPRIPGHPSDMPSSRPTGQHESQPVTQSAGAPVSSTHIPAKNHQVRNIIIGGIVTITTSVLIYYLTVYQNKPSSGSSHLEAKEATVSAWKSYMAYENVYTRNVLSHEKDLLATGDMNTYFTGFKTESEKFLRDMEELKETKKIDPDLRKALNRRLDNEKILIPKFEEYIKRTKKIISDTLFADDKRKALLDNEIQWIRYYKGAFERAINDLNEIATLLSERYGHAFDLKQFLVIEMFPQRIKTIDSSLQVATASLSGSHTSQLPELDYAKNLNASSLIGNWSASGAVFSFFRDGKFKFVVAATGEIVSGTWKIETDKVKMDGIVNNKEQEKLNWIFLVANLKPDSMTLVLEDKKTRYSLARIPGN